MASLVYTAGAVPQLRRGYQYHSSVTVTTVAAGTGTDSIDYRNFAGGSVTASSTNSAVTLTFIHSPASSTGPYRALYDKDNTAVTLTVAGNRSVELPHSLFGCAFVKCYGDVAASLGVFCKG